MWLQGIILSFLFVSTFSHEVSHPLATYSFQPPYNSLTSWEIRGSTTVSEEYIRLTPNAKERSGYITNRKPYNYPSLELTLEFHIHSEEAVGADGMALWLTDQPINQRGPVFGGPETWTGMLIVLDTYDNNGQDEHPFIMLHYNDGNDKFEFHHDGSSTYIGGCHAKYRNQPKSLLHLFIEHNFVSLFIDNNGDGDWQLCVGPIGLHMPNEIFFSVSGATGGFSDNHDILSFKVNTLEETAVELYKPPADLITEQKEQIKEKVLDKQADEIFTPLECKEECVVTAECINFYELQTIADRVEDFEEDVGSQLVAIQNSITDAVKRLETQFTYLNNSYTARVTDIVNIKTSLQDGVASYNQIRNAAIQYQSSLSTPLSKVKEYCATIQRFVGQIQMDQGSLLSALDIQISVVVNSSSSDYGSIAIFVLVLLQFLVYLTITLRGGKRDLY